MLNFGRSESTLHQNLPKMLHDGGEYYSLSFLDKKPSLANYWFFKDPVLLQAYLCMLVTGYKKQGSPLVDLDPTTRGVLNDRGYFSYSIGETFCNQMEAVTDNLALRRIGTYLFAPVYNLQKAQIRARLWALSLVPVRDDGKWKLFGQAVFGHCSIWPILPYEILGAMAVLQATAKVVKLPLHSVGWMFQRLNFDTVPDKIKDKMSKTYKTAKDCWTELPKEQHANEVLRIERQLRKDANFRPNLTQPLPANMRSLVDGIQTLYKGGANAGD